VNYVGAGTIEFVSDGKEVFFIEMNTRLQVEHPVTELITGIDLVEWQLRVAFGEALPLRQDEIKLNGHAVEARVYAENPTKNFMPSVGRISTWRLPEETGGLRIDAGYREGDMVSPYYDAMLAKMIAWAPTRDVAVERLNRALEESDVRGIVTNIPFLSALMTHPKVRTNAIDTGFIERELAVLTQAAPAPGELELCAAVAAIVNDERRMAEANSPWQTFGWQPVGRRQRSFAFRVGHGPEQKIILNYGSGPSTLVLGDRELAFAIAPRDGGFDLTLDGVKSQVAAVIDGHELYLRTRNGRFDLHWVDPFGGESEEQTGEDKIAAPLPGTVVAVLAEEGATLEKGAPILTLEVMKMEQTLRAPYAGVLKSIRCKVGDIVQEGVELAVVEPAGE
jgi:3-methylcrotonyl-CoA carboxylase alpha subunit